MILLGLALTIVACSGYKESEDNSFTRTVSLSSPNFTMNEGETVEVSAVFEGPGTAGFGYEWLSDNTEILLVEPTQKFSVASLTAVAPGSATVSFVCTDEHYPELSASIQVTVEKDENGVLKVLAIGNSFSEDAVEQNLYELLYASGQKSIIGNMYIGGCTLERHWNNAQNDVASYSFRKVVGGEKKAIAGYTLEKALTEEEWDIVSVQQQSGLSGIQDSYEPYLSNLTEYIRSKVSNNDVKIIFHQTWAYAQNSTHKDFSKYDKNQMTMYNAIAEVSKKIDEEKHDFEFVVPAGTAVQNARTSYMGDTFCRDGYHMERTYGRYLVACTWFEALTGKSVIGNKYTPLEDATQTLLMQTAAHRALINPFAVTDMVDFKDKPTLDNQ